VNHEEYKDYLRSERWRKTRIETLIARNCRCERCGAGGVLEVHHRSYASLGAERPEDLEVLCRECHFGKHFPLIVAIAQLLSLVGGRRGRRGDGLGRPLRQISLWK
jgi:5-methylcytosine-specific restriction endonuclease McrA